MAKFEQLREFSVFLASPSDLREERELAALVIEDANAILREEGWCIRLIVWEDIPPGTGRAQDIINKYADQCHLFVGMLWRLWGSKPAKNSKYKSGFEEEYRRAQNLWDTQGAPEIWMYFRTVEQEFLNDLGPGLKRVLKFRKNFEKAFSGKYHTFSSPQEWHSLFSKHLLQRVLRLIREERAAKLLIQEAPSSAALTEPATENSPDTSGFSKDTEKVISRIGAQLCSGSAERNLTRLDSAKLSLVATHFAASFSNENFLGTHEANHLYINRNSMALEWKEREVLIRSALSNYETGVYPIWFWFREDSPSSALTYLAAYDGNERVRRGALRTMAEFGIAPDDSIFSRNDFFVLLFEEKTPKEIRGAACQLLGQIGSRDELPFLIAEIDRNISETKRHAEHGLIDALSRFSTLSALKEVITRQLSIGDRLDTLTAHFSELEIADLRAGLEHKDAEIRLECAREIHARHSLDESTIDTLLNDSSHEVRVQGLIAKIDAGETFNRETLGKYLTKTEKRSALGLFGGGSTSAEVDSKQIDRLLKRQFKRMTREALISKLSWFDSENELLYEVMAEQGIITLERVRHDLLDQFASLKKESIDKLTITLGQTAAQQHVEIYQKYDDGILKRLCVAAAVALAKNRQASDLDTIRTNFTRENLFRYSNDGLKAIAVFLGEFGDRADLGILLTMSTSSSFLAPSMFPKDDDVKSAVVSICVRDFTSVLADANISYWIGQIVPIVPLPVLQSLSAEIRGALFRAENVDTRAAIAQRWFAELSRSEIEKFLEEYTGGGSYFYNVVIWADRFAYGPRGRGADRLLLN